jgi:hypothetical protein
MFRRTGKWLTYAQHECLLLVGPVSGRDFIVVAMNMPTCPRCGQRCDLMARDTWARVVRRKVWDGQLLKPWTWRRWHWEYRELGHLAEGGFNYRQTMRNARRDGTEGRPIDPDAAETPGASPSHA